MNSPPLPAKTGKPALNKGFTLIELAIVLVVIGLIIGTVLVGQSLTGTATIRAQITQLEKYNTAANAFRSKYGYLPGDLTSGAASQFGFIARAGGPGRGDGNGVIQAYNYNLGFAYGASYGGETAFFWEDLYSANMSNDGVFNTATDAIMPLTRMTTSPSLTSYLPHARLNNQNALFLYIRSDGSNNYFVISTINQIDDNGAMWGDMGTPGFPGVSVAQAFAIDSKIDDGFPQTGRVTAQYSNTFVAEAVGCEGSDGTICWAAAGNVQGTVDTSATASSATTCYDNAYAGGVAATQHYSVEINGGVNLNCAISVRMQ